MSNDPNENQILPPIRLLFRSKEGLEVFTVPSSRDEEASIQLVENRTFILQGSTSFQTLHTDGSAVFVHKPERGILKIDLTETDTTTMTTTMTPFFNDTTKVQIMDISPQGTFVLTWERAQEGDIPNLKVWNTKTGAYVTGFRQKALRKESWPYVQWTNDETFAFVMGTNEIRVYPGTFPLGTETRFVDRLKLPGISSMSLPSHATGAVRVLFTTFCPPDKNKPAKATMYEYPPKTQPVANASYPALLSKSLFQAEEMTVHWSPKGDAALIALQTTVDTSGQSYYGSTSLFLMNPTQQPSDAIAVPLPQEGPVLDVAWMPNGTKPPCFVVIAGRMPSMASLHDGTGKATFLFGNAHRNTIAWAPHGRFVCLAGFGNLAGGISFWDKNKLKIIPSSAGPNITASCTVGYGWSPCSRLFFSSTTSPRMNVDNGVKLFRYNGDQFARVPWKNNHYQPDRLLQVAFVPARPSVYPDRPQSPTLKDLTGPDNVSSSSNSNTNTSTTSAAGSNATAGTGTIKPMGRYVPPSARNRVVGGGIGSQSTSLAERMRAEKEAHMKGAQKVVQPTTPQVVGVTGKVVVGLAPTQPPKGKSKSALRREKLKQKKEEEATRKALEERVAQTITPSTAAEAASGTGTATVATQGSVQ